MPTPRFAPVSLVSLFLLSLPGAAAASHAADSEASTGTMRGPIPSLRAPSPLLRLLCPEGSGLVVDTPPKALEQGCEAVLPTGGTVRRGPWRTWYPDGNLASDGEYLDGEMHGTWFRYHPGGFLSAQGPYLRGQEHGIWSTWSSEGRLIQTGSYSRGQKTGEWKSWFETGVIMEAGSYTGGLREGTWTLFYDMGVKKEIGTYLSGKKTGLWTLFGPDGRKAEEGQYRDGVKVGAWTVWYAGTGPVDLSRPVVATEPPAPKDPGSTGVVGNDGRFIVLSDLQKGGAEELAPITTTELKGLKPSLWRLPPNPKATTDYTAYTLEGGEFKVGLLSIGVGLLDNVQVSTMPVLWYVGLPNVNFKVDAIRQGPVDIALQGGRFWLNQDAFRASYTTVGTIGSLSIFKYWGIHAGVNYAGMAAQGQPDICAISSFLTDAECTSPTGGNTHTGSPLSMEGNDIYGEVISVKFATDIRFNRRDSLILQASAINWARVHKSDTVNTPDIAELDKVFQYNGSVPLNESYVASAAWQFAWKNAHLRLGWGVSAIPYAFVTQAAEFSIRFGGTARTEQGRRWKMWERNKTDARKGDLDDATGTPENQEDK